MMTTTIVFETHSVSEDNERGIATGWLPGRLSTRGRALAQELGARRRDDGLAAVFSSDLTRAASTAQLAFAASGLPVLLDWRLRECDYGRLNGAGQKAVHGDRFAYLDRSYPGGESWRQAVARVVSFLPDLVRWWPGERVLVIGHVATRLAFDVALNGATLDTVLTADFDWQPGWEYRLQS